MQYNLGQKTKHNYINSSINTMKNKHITKGQTHKGKKDYYLFAPSLSLLCKHSNFHFPSPRMRWVHFLHTNAYVHPTVKISKPLKFYVQHFKHFVQPADKINNYQLCSLKQLYLSLRVHLTKLKIIAWFNCKFCTFMVVSEQLDP